MAMEPEEPRKKQTGIVAGEDLSSLSEFELEARITILQEEIVRAQNAIAARKATRSAADSFFKR